MHGLGHALMAIAAATCARTLLAANPALLYKDSTHLAFVLALGGLGAICAKVLGGALAARAQARVAGEVACDLRLRVLDGWLRAVACGVARHPDHGLAGDPAQPSSSARALGALTTGVRELEQGLSQGIMGGIRSTAQLVPLAILLVVLAPKLGGAALLALAIFGWGLGRARRALKRAHVDAGAKADALLEAADDVVRHADVWATYGAGDHVRARVSALGQSWTQQSSRLELLGSALSGSSELLAALALVVVLGLVSAGVISSPDASLVPFAVVFFLAYRPLRELGDARGALMRARAGLDRLAPWIFSEAPDPKRTTRTEWPMASLEVQGLALLHGDLLPLSLSIAPGEIVVLRGPTGIGKSTLLRTLLGLDRALAGDVRYGGEDISAAPAGPHTRPFAWVPQDAPLLLGSLDDNLHLGAPHGKEDALDMIGGSRLRRELGDGRLAVDRSLSGGERQWVAIARALATEQPVILFDEPTSGLDPDAQRLVLAAIQSLRGKRSVLLVTHREEPMAIADRVVSLE